MTTASRITTLSQAIAHDTELVEQYFVEQGLPSPTFDVDGPQNLRLPSKGPVFEAYERVVDNTRELHMLMIGSSKAIRSFAHLDTMTVQAIYRLKIAERVPINGAASFEQLAAFAKVDSAVLRRILRFAMTNFIFYEDPPGMVRHTLLSRRLAEDSVVQGAVSMLVNESFPGSTRSIASLIENGNTKDPMQCGWVLANNAQAPFYEELNARLPERAKPVANAMDLLAQITPVDQLVHCYPWAELGSATVVDIGGGRGPVSIALAQAFPALTCIVQDLPALAQSGTEALPPGLAGRVKFMPHNFFDQQPVKHADVYFFRYIFHDWPEDHGVKILRALIPALKVGSRVIINEFAIPDRGTVSEAAYKFQRAIDMNMMVYFNGQERELFEWKILIDKVHPRLKFLQAYHPKNEALDVMMLACQARSLGKVHCRRSFFSDQYRREMHRL